MTDFATEIGAALGPELGPGGQVQGVGQGRLPSWFRVSDFAVATVQAAASEVCGVLDQPAAQVDRRRVLKWFDMTVRPQGWDLPSVWDAVAGNYPCADGWIRLHTNAPHHRDAALSVLGCAGTREAVAEAVAGWTGEALETAIVAAKGCAAQMRGLRAWAAHPQGAAVGSEPLIAWGDADVHGPPLALQGLRVLDLTRVLAGPVSTRFLAGFGAQVLRIDPPGWNEPAVEQEVTLGKRCAGLDLTLAADRAVFADLLRRADVLVHGYRPGALDGLGFGAAERRALAPGLIEVSLNAYGHSGPWAARRGFDSLVQMSCGIASEGRDQAGSETPVPLPVQALDHGTGYLMAAAVLRALRVRAETGRTLHARLSLARTACLLTSGGVAEEAADMAPEGPGDLADGVEQTSWGPAQRVAFPVAFPETFPGIYPGEFKGAPVVWPCPAGALRRDVARW